MVVVFPQCFHGFTVVVACETHSAALIGAIDYCVLLSAHAVLTSFIF